MCPSISNILRPKTPDEISQSVIDMNTYEFIYKFQKFNIKGLHINFKKKIAYFFIVTLKKHWNKVYWPIWALWAISTIVSLILKSNKIEIPLPLTIIKYVGISFIYFALFPITISLIYNIKFTKWQNKRENFYEGRLNQEMINRLIEISERNAEILRNREHNVEQMRQRIAERVEEQSRRVEENIAQQRQQMNERIEEQRRRMQENIRRYRRNT